jgi:radical SAM protein (TIGR01212 family)
MKASSDKLIYRFRDFLRERYPYPVRKLPLHTGLGCPHRDAGDGSGGCIYCYNPGFSEVSADTPDDVGRQLERGIDRSRKRGFDGKFIAYFQTGTNTYADIRQLESWWRLVERYPEDIVGLSVGTRPDCLSEDIFELLDAFGEKFMVWLELGLQSANDATLARINRGHDYRSFADAAGMARLHGNILICAHIILGLPGEGIRDMEHTVSALNGLGVHGVKIHHLQVVKHTLLAKWHARGDVQVCDENEYVGLLVQLLPRLSSRIVVHRLVGDIRDDLLIAPRWKLPKARVIQMVEQRLLEAGMHQGALVD